MEGRFSGRDFARKITDRISERIVEAAYERPPKLAVVLVGDRADSNTYVRMKQKAGAAIGILVDVHRREPTVTVKEIEDLVDRLNADDTVDGIIVQLPLPEGPLRQAEANILNRVAPHKDVDGFNTEHLGRLMTLREWNAYDCDFFTPCTPRGVIWTLLEIFQADGLKGKTVALIGCGMVGKPLTMMLIHYGVTVLCCHRDTPPEEMQEMACAADIVIGAAGCSNLIKADWVHGASCLIDVGINRVWSDTKQKWMLTGDITHAAKQKSWVYTPVPGGVGPITVAMLLQAVFESWNRSRIQAQEAHYH